MVLGQRQAHPLGERLGLRAREQRGYQRASRLTVFGVQCLLLTYIRGRNRGDRHGQVTQQCGKGRQQVVDVFGARHGGHRRQAHLRGEVVGAQHHFERDALLGPADPLFAHCAQVDPQLAGHRGGAFLVHQFVRQLPVGR